jgi:hypothetical protein
MRSYEPHGNPSTSQCARERNKTYKFFASLAQLRLHSRELYQRGACKKQH